MNATPQGARHRREDPKAYQGRHTIDDVAARPNDRQPVARLPRRKGVIAVVASLAAIGLAVGVADTSWALTLRRSPPSPSPKSRETRTNAR